MPLSLPVISGKQVCRALGALGFAAVRQKGSHVIMRRGLSVCVVPDHREVKTGTLAGILKQAGVFGEEFLSALGKP